MIWKTTEGGLREYLRHFDTEDLVCYYSFFDTCPRCDSLNTCEMHVSHPNSGVEVIRRCENCGKEWKTKIYSNEWLEQFECDDEQEGGT